MGTRVDKIEFNQFSMKTIEPSQIPCCINIDTANRPVHLAENDH